jgi:hypothetical protein
MTETDPDRTDATRAQRHQDVVVNTTASARQPRALAAPAPRVATVRGGEASSRRPRRWATMLTAVVAVALVVGTMAGSPTSVAAQECPPESPLCPQPKHRKHKHHGPHGGRHGQDGGRHGQKGGRHGRDTGRPDLTDLAPGGAGGGEEVGGTGSAGDAGAAEEAGDVGGTGEAEGSGAAEDADGAGGAETAGDVEDVEAAGDVEEAGGAGGAGSAAPVTTADTTIPQMTVPTDPLTDFTELIETLQLPDFNERTVISEIVSDFFGPLLEDSPFFGPLLENSPFPDFFAPLLEDSPLFPDSGEPLP